MILHLFLIGWSTRAVAVAGGMFVTADAMLEAVVELGSSWPGVQRPPCRHLRSHMLSNGSLDFERGASNTWDDQGMLVGKNRVVFIPMSGGSIVAP